MKKLRSKIANIFSKLLLKKLFIVKEKKVCFSDTVQNAVLHTIWMIESLRDFYWIVRLILGSEKNEVYHEFLDYIDEFLFIVEL